LIEFNSERLCFRELREDDVSQRYIGWLNDPAITRFLETRFAAQTEDGIKAFVAAVRADPDAHLLRIGIAETDEHIGNIKLGPINRHHLSAQISLLIGERRLHGCGFATEAVSRVTEWGFAELGLKRIEGGCYEDNLGSLRAFLKAGYEVEGFMRKSRISVEGRRVGAFWFARLAPDAPDLK
jgi:RimJ/RimL family protein N-acetyltransferase